MRDRVDRGRAAEPGSFLSLILLVFALMTGCFRVSTAAISVALELSLKTRCRTYYFCICGTAEYQSLTYESLSEKALLSNNFIVWAITKVSNQVIIR